MTVTGRWKKTDTWKCKRTDTVRWKRNDTGGERGQRTDTER